MNQKSRVSQVPYKDISVLIFGAGGRQALPVCKGFYKLGCRVTVYCRSRTDTGYLTRYSTDKILYRRDNPFHADFMEYGAQLIRRGIYDLVVPLGDATATFLSNHKKELCTYAKIAVNDWEVFSKVIDKEETMRICMENGIPAPKTLLSENPAAELDRLNFSYPVVVKPRTGVGSIGFNIIHSREALEEYLASYENQNGPILIQEYIEQGDAPQYGVDLFRDRNGVIRSLMVLEKSRWYPLDGGSTVFASTIHNKEIADSCALLVQKLNWNGFADIDLVWDIKEHRAKILEINGRTGARIKLDYLCGIDVSKLMIENELGKTAGSILDYPDGKSICCFLADCLWFVKSKKRFSSQPSWFVRKGTGDVIFSWDDPLPTLGFLIDSIVSYRTSMKNRIRFEDAQSAK